MNIEKHRAFLDSLEGEKGLPEEMHEPSGWRFDMPIKDFLNTCDPSESKGRKLIGDYLLERLKRAESRQIADLKERVKELVRDAMDAQAAYDPDPVYDVKTGKQVVGYSEAEQFRALCEPEKDSKEASP